MRIIYLQDKIKNESNYKEKKLEMRKQELELKKRKINLIESQLRFENKQKECVLNMEIKEREQRLELEKL